MKRLIIALLLTIPTIAFSQNSYLDGVFEKYSGKQGYTSVYITKYMFELFAEINNDDELKEFQDITSSLESIKILTTSVESTAEQMKELKKALTDKLPKAQYKDLMIIKEDGTDVSFKIRKEGSKIIELMMVADNKLQTVLIYLSGDINLKKISKLSKSMNVSGFEYLNRIDDQ